MHILLVEDVPSNQEVVIGLLADTGIHIDVADNGLQALEKLQAAPAKYQLIFMDMEMPQMDGISATKSIRNDAARYGTAPIIAMTANAFSEDVQNCLNAGMIDHISKPVEEKKILKMLVQYASA